MSTFDTREQVEVEALKERSGWILALGILMAIGGVVAFVAPLAASLTIATFVGWLFIIAGAIQLVSSFGASRGGALVLNLVLAALSIGGGIWLLSQPLKGTFTLTVVLAATLIASGIVQVTAALLTSGVEGRGFVIVSGVLTVLLGALIWAKLPSSADWAIGLLAGIHFLSRGLELIMLGLAVRRA
jgi:uncharacterized membrane protein HdeD (DUF308 family)